MCKWAGEAQVTEDGKRVSRWLWGQEENPGTSGGRTENGRCGEMKGKTWLWGSEQGPRETGEQTVTDELSLKLRHYKVQKKSIHFYHYST